MKKPLFIVLEGGEGSGKTTQAQLLKQELEKITDQNILLTREPGGLKECEQIRDIIMGYDLNFQTEALLFAASRASLVDQVIKPALKKQDIVICDRYFYSSVVYQGIVRGLGAEKIMQINEWATDFLYPDRVYFFDIKPNDALLRLDEKAREINRFDQEKIDFHQQVYDGYKTVLNEVDFARNIDATLNVDIVTQLIIEDLKMSYFE